MAISTRIRGLASAVPGAYGVSNAATSISAERCCRSCSAPFVERGVSRETSVIASAGFPLPVPRQGGEQLRWSHGRPGDAPTYADRALLGGRHSRVVRCGAHQGFAQSHTRARRRLTNRVRGTYGSIGIAVRVRRIGACGSGLCTRLMSASRTHGIGTRGSRRRSYCVERSRRQEYRQRPLDHPGCPSSGSVRLVLPRCGGDVRGASLARAMSGAARRPLARRTLARREWARRAMRRRQGRMPSTNRQQDDSASRAVSILSSGSERLGSPARARRDPVAAVDQSCRSDSPPPTRHLRPATPDMPPPPATSDRPRRSM